MKWRNGENNENQLMAWRENNENVSDNEINNENNNEKK
jgi:hypothetical protein